jgi:hypothetical protein
MALVQELMRADITREVIARAPDADQSATVAIDVYAGAGELRSAVAVQQALQMSIDAAAIVIDAASRDATEIGLEDVEALLRERIVDLRVVTLSAGSIRGRFTINPRTENGQRRLLAIGGVAIIALHIAFPPLAPFLLAVGAAKELGEIIRPDAVPPSEAPPKSVDPTDLSSADAQVRITLRPDEEEATHADAAAPPSEYVYDVDIHGPSPANVSFLDRILGLEGVDKQSRPIIGEEYQRIRIWASKPINADTLERLAKDAGTEIVGTGHAP